MPTIAPVDKLPLHNCITAAATVKEVVMDDCVGVPNEKHEEEGPV